MSDSNIPHLLLDTSYLREVGFNDPDFRKLLHLSKKGSVKIFVPHIVWEERRTQLVEKVVTKVRKLRNDVESLKVPWLGGLDIDGLTSPSLNVWTEAEIEEKSKGAMAKFAAEHNVEIMPIASDHASRAWIRYFNASQPFNPDEERSNRRRDIPDSWIFETAIDMVGQYGKVSALCADGRLSKALVSIGFTVFKGTVEFLDVVEPLEPPGIPPAIDAVHAAPIGNAEARVNLRLASADAQFREVERKVLGYVGYLGTPTKDELFGLLSRGDYPTELVRNAAERLALEGLIRDTGNHYLPGDKEVCEQAASLVESEIIKLLG